MVILLYGSWNHVNSRWVAFVEDALSANNDAMSPSPGIKVMAAAVKVDADDESYDLCVSEEGSGGFGAPSDLPALLFLGSPTNKSDVKGNNQRLRVEHVQFNSGALESLLTRPIDSMSSSAQKSLVSPVCDAWSRLFDNQGNVLPPQSKTKVSRNINSSRNSNNTNEPAIRLFIAGDRSQVGKSSICLGLLGALLNSGKYKPSDLAYIKPATQCEQTQLVEHYCKDKGITACVPVGPIVYYKGFTRSFLKGETGETSEQMLQKASDAVDKLALNKKVVIIDGVGYPAVGSITGTDNASVAKVCGRSFSIPKSTGATASRSAVPVLLIGKSGVGDAVDSFNINATYFTHKNVPVIGAIFNKLSLDGFYSLANCKEAIDMYFRQSQPDRAAFGFIPEIPSLKNAREHVANNSSKEDQLKQALETADLFVSEFSKHVNVDRIVTAAKEATAKYIAERTPQLLSTTLGSKRPVGEMESVPNITTKNAKHPRSDMAADGNGISLSRVQIEAIASSAGAAAGA